MHQMSFQRFCAWSGVICVALFFGAFALAGFIPPLKPHMSAQEIADHYRANTTGIRIGGVVMLLSGAFYACYTAVISAQMRRIPSVHPAAVYVQLAAGAFGCLTFLIPAMLLEWVAFRPERLPEDTQAYNDLFWIMLVMPWPPFMAQNYAFSYAILTDPRQADALFPRWLAYLNIWCPIVFSPAILLPFFKSGPFSWAGIFVMWIPACVFIIQFVANTTMLLRAINREERELEAGREPAVPPPEPVLAN
jgi:hypothetical protein